MSGKILWWGVAILPLIATCQNPSRQQTYIAEVPFISTFSGQTGAGGAVVTGPGANATFNTPAQGAVDASGNLYMTDILGQCILKIAPDGEVSLYAGIVGTPSTNIGNPQNGPRLQADFVSPQGLAIDKADNLYVADNGNQLLRKIAPDGTVSTVAGSGSAGFSDGQGSAASFYFPTSLAVDRHGTVYMTDLYNHAIRKITASGYVSTLAGSGGGGTPGTAVYGYVNGPGASALFYYPQGITCDASDNLYVTDENNVIRKITPAGFVTTLAGQSPQSTGGAQATSTYQDGAADQAFFSAPGGIVARGSDVYVVDSGGGTIRKISRGLVSTFAGRVGQSGYTNGPGLTATFSLPSQLALDQNGNIFVIEGNDSPGPPYGDAVRKLTFKPAL